MTTDVETLKAKFVEEKKQLIARQKAEKAKFSKAASRQANRRKIILGSILLKHVAGKSKNVTEFLRGQLTTLNERDKALFPELFPAPTQEPNKQ